jgi:hypothetical protein
MPELASFLTSKEPDKANRHNAPYEFASSYRRESFLSKTRPTCPRSTISPTTAHPRNNSNVHEPHASAWLCALGVPGAVSWAVGMGLLSVGPGASGWLGSVGRCLDRAHRSKERPGQSTCPQSSIVGKVTRPRPDVDWRVRSMHRAQYATPISLRMISQARYHPFPGLSRIRQSPETCSPLVFYFVNYCPKYRDSNLRLMLDKSAPLWLSITHAATSTRATTNCLSRLSNIASHHCRNTFWVPAALNVEASPGVHTWRREVTAEQAATRANPQPLATTSKYQAAKQASEGLNGGAHIGDARSPSEGRPAGAARGRTLPTRGTLCRWDHLSTEQRRACSAAISTLEAAEQERPSRATPGQHRFVALILDRAATTTEHEQGAA